MKSRVEKLKSHSAEKEEDSEVSTVLTQSHHDESDNYHGGYWKWPTIEPAPFQIPQQKWQDILTDEGTCYIIDSCREEIVKSAMDKIYDLVNLKYEPEETPTPLKFWLRDKEQGPSPMDPWIFGNVGICRKTKTLNTSERCSTTVQEDTVLTDVHNSSHLPSGDKSNRLKNPFRNIENSEKDRERLSSPEKIPKMKISSQGKRANEHL